MAYWITAFIAGAVAGVAGVFVATAIDALPGRERGSVSGSSDLPAWEARTGGTEDRVSAADFQDNLQEAPDLNANDDPLWRAQKVAGQWAKEDPSAAFAACMEIADYWRRRSLLERILAEWIQWDAEAALATAGGVEHALLRNDLLAACLNSISETDPRDAFNRLETLPGLLRSENSLRLVTSIFSNWTKQNAGSAREKMETISNPVLRRAALRGFAEGRARANPADAVAWAKGLPNDRERMQAVRTVLSIADPETVRQNLHELGDGLPKQQLLEGQVSVWASQDVAATVRWVRELPQGDMRDAAALHLAKELAATYPEEVPGLLDDLPLSPQRQDALFSIARMMSASDPVFAASWIAGLPVKDQMRSMHQLGSSWARIDPEAASNHALTLEGDPALLRVYSAGVVESWESPQEAVSWAAALPGKVRLEAYPVAIGRWGASFPQEAAAHILAQGDADLLNAAAPRLVTQWVRQDPSEAVQWAVAFLPEGEARRESLRVIAQEWMQTDPARAEKWIQSLPPGPSTDSVLEAIGQGSGVEPPD